MNIFMACPAPPRSLKGNRVTAARWANILKKLGHRLTIDRDYDGRLCDLLIALHAWRSYPAVAAYRKQYPHGPLIVALTGTDLYRDIRTSKRAQRSLDLADRLVLLQPRGVDELAPRLRSKARTIYQSAEPVGDHPPDMTKGIDAIVMGHLRHEKDPFRAAMALRLLPADVPVRVTHLGQALTPAMADRAVALMKAEPRYRWLGEVPRNRARRLLARSHLLVHTSRMEGGANVISEALADGVPMLASRIGGNVGLLGARYPGYYPVGDTAALARLMTRAAAEAAFYPRLKQWCIDLHGLTEPRREEASWQALLNELVSEPSHAREDEALE